MALQEPTTRRSETTRDRILTAAEEAFAASGYDGTPLRQIAGKADVPTALLNYHFGSKEGLYRAIFERHITTIYDLRVAGLQLAKAEPDLDRRVELVVRTLIFPMFGLRASSRSSHFGQIMVRELSDPGGETRGIFRDMFDPVAHLMIEAIGGCFPDWSKKEVHWAYHTMLGAMMIVMLDAGRIERLSDGDCSPENHEEAAAHVIAILTAGLKHRQRDQSAAMKNKTERIS